MKTRMSEPFTFEQGTNHMKTRMSEPFTFE